MKKLSYYKESLTGLSDVRETVKVIEKKAASHIHLLKKQVEALKQYRESCKNILLRLSGYYWDSDHPLLKSQGRKKELIVITSDKGIVGGLYHNIVEKLIDIKDSYDSVIVIGKKGEEFVREEGIKADTLPFGLDDYPNSEEFQLFSKIFFERFVEQNLGRTDVLYSQFISLAYQKPEVSDFLPFNFIKNTAYTGENEIDIPGYPVFEGSKKSTFNELLRRFINVYFTEIFWEAKLSEFSARTVEAENATIKTEEIIGKINLEFIKERRKNITQKQLESFAVHKNI